MRLLNSILDNSLKPLVSPTDTSLSEIFLEIRRQLLQDDRELVLLVEDFAVLSGIQGALLDAMIREGVRGGIDACVMRTALAVTTGYDFGRYDTVKTRAVYGWHVDESDADDDDKMLRRIGNYVGAYLNAARFGSAELKQRHAQLDHEQWPPNFAVAADLSDIEQKQLDAFGRCPSGWHLFPFNEAAVRQFAEQHLRLRASNKLGLNPRAIINHLLIAVLRDYRSDYLRGEFPTAALLLAGTNKMNQQLPADVRDCEPSGPMQKRYLALLRYWGDNPDRLRDSLLTQPVYEAFGLKALSGAPSVVRPIEGRPIPPRAVTPPISPVSADGSCRQATEIQVDQPTLTTTQPDELRRWEETLNAWSPSPSSTLQQKDANEIRLLICNQVLSAIDWDSLLLRSLGVAEMKGWQGFIYLPNAKGSGSTSHDNAMCAVCSPEDFNDVSDSGTRGTIVRALIALTKHEYHKSWDYDESERDYACWANLLEKLVPQATSWLLAKRYHGVAGDPVPALVESLLVGARMLNVKTSHASDHASLLNAIFEPAPPLPTTVVCDEWRELTREVSDHRETLQSELLARVAVRQGGADKTYGIDAVRLLDHVRAFNRSGWKVSAQTPDATASNDALNKAATFARRFIAKLSTAMGKRNDALAAIRQKYQSQLGNDFDKQALVETLKNIIAEAQKFGVLDSDLPKAAELQKLCEEFRAAPVTDCLKKLAASGSDDFGTQLSSLAQVDDATLDLINRFVATMSNCLRLLERGLETELTNEGCIEKTTLKIEGVLDDLNRQLNRFGGPTS